MIKKSPAPQITLPELINCLKTGLLLAISKECRTYIIIPIIVNIIILSVAGYVLYSYMSAAVYYLFDMFPEFLLFLAYIVIFLLGTTIVFAGFYIFSTVATIIASPFYGLLADKAELILSGKSSDDMSFAEIMKDVPRILAREMRKQMYFLPRLLGCLIISVIPGVNIVSPVLWFLLAAFMGSIQYCDYAYDNHKIPFAVMKQDLSYNLLTNLSFGGIVSVCISIPLLNLIVPPAAVCAGTKIYLEIQKKKGILEFENSDKQ